MGASLMASCARLSLRIDGKLKAVMDKFKKHHHGLAGHAQERWIAVTSACAPKG